MILAQEQVTKLHYETIEIRNGHLRWAVCPYCGADELIRYPKPARASHVMYGRCRCGLHLGYADQEHAAIVALLSARLAPVAPEPRFFEQIRYISGPLRLPANLDALLAEAAA